MSGTGSNQSTRLDSIKKSVERIGLKSAFGEQLVAQPIPSIQLHWPYNINSELVTDNSTGSGSIAQANSMLEVHSGAATSSQGQMLSNESVEYNPGQGVDVRWTALFDTPVAGNQQYIGVGDSQDSFFVGYDEITFGILYRNDSVDTWIPQSTWNHDKMDGTGESGETLDPSKGNVFRCQYQWLGFGNITFYIESSETEEFILIHHIHYPNNNTAPSLAIPNLPMCATSVNTTNNTDIVLKSASMGAFIQGLDTSASHTRNAISNTKAVTTELNVLTIQNRTTFASKTNKVRIQPDFLSIAADGTKNVTINVYLNTTLGGTPAFTNISTNTSVAAFDIAGTTVTGGILIASFAVAKTGDKTIQFRDFNFLLPPGDTFTISAQSTGSNDVTAAIGWEERW